ncbi:hypothetical protein ABPG74_018220 [Tetrahymena malaccensis]
MNSKIDQAKETLVKHINSQKSYQQKLDELNKIIDYLHNQLEHTQLEELQEDKEYPISVLSWNLKGVTRSSTQSIKKIASLIQYVNADIICLQEINNKEKEDAQTNYESVVSQIIQLQESDKWAFEEIKAGRGFQYTETSSIIYNKKKLKKISDVELDEKKFIQFARTPQIIQFKILKSNLVFSVSNFHIKDGSSDEQKMHDELSQLKGISDSLLKQDNQFNLLVGDFNYEFIDDESFSEYFKKIPFYCVPKNTMVRSQKCFDQIFAVSNKLEIKFLPIEIEKELTQLTNKQQVSDHYPLASKFKISSITKGSKEIISSDQKIIKK